MLNYKYVNFSKTGQCTISKNFIKYKILKQEGVMRVDSVENEQMIVIVRNVKNK